MGFHGNSINNTNAIKTKTFLRDPQIHMYPLSKFHFNSSCHLGVRWGVPFLGQGVSAGKKHLGWMRVNPIRTGLFASLKRLGGAKWPPS